jgi:hypothetical protein
VSSKCPAVAKSRLRVAKHPSPGVIANNTACVKAAGRPLRGARWAANLAEFMESPDGIDGADLSSDVGGRC